VGFDVVARRLDLRQPQTLCSRWLDGRGRGGDKDSCHPRDSVFGLAASGSCPPGILGCAGINFRADSASGSYAEWWGLHAMATYFEFNSFGYAVLAALWGPGAARVLWLIAFTAVAGWLFARWAWLQQSLCTAPMARVLLAFFLLSPVVNPWYLVWLVPFIAATPTRGAVALLVAVPLSYATGLNLGDPTLAPYNQPAWVRPVEFGVYLTATLSSYWPMR